MNPRQFFERVKVMRHFQKEYFKTHSPTALRQSKALELEIDQEIDRVNRLLNLPDHKKTRTPSLFDNEKDQSAHP